MGHLNAGGTAVVTFLLLARECGVDVPDHALLGALIHFYRYSGRGHNPYGDGRPEVGFVDNGNLAFAMAADAALTPDGENSVYARARDACAMTSFYSTGFMLHGHTGGFRLATVVDVAPYNPPVAGSFCGTVFGAGGGSSASTAGSAVASS
jgi:hypothetical protein